MISIDNIKFQLKDREKKKEITCSNLSSSDKFFFRKYNNIYINLCFSSLFWVIRIVQKSCLAYLLIVHLVYSVLPIDS